MTPGQATALRRLRTRGRMYTEIGRRKLAARPGVFAQAALGALMVPAILLLVWVAV